MQKPIYFALACWLGCISAGLTWLNVYASTSSSQGETPQQWPMESQLPLPENSSQLVMFVHPRCPCTQASLAELDRVITKHRDQVLLVASVPPDFESGKSNQWMNSPARRWALARNVKLTFDIGGQEAERFGAHASGFCAVYDAEGQLQFRGGITQTRGHEGWNAGTEAIVNLLNNKSTVVAEHPVFGCCLVREQLETDRNGK